MPVTSRPKRAGSAGRHRTISREVDPAPSPVAEGERRPAVLRGDPDASRRSSARGRPRGAAGTGGRAPPASSLGRRPPQSGHVSAPLIAPAPFPFASDTESHLFLVGKSIAANVTGPLRGLSPPGRRRGPGSRRRPGRRRRRSPRSPRAAGGRSGAGGGGRRRGRSLRWSPASGRSPRRSRLGVSGQHGDQLLEPGRPARVVVLAAEPVDDAAEEGQGPGPVEDPLRGHLVGGFEGVAALGIEGVDGERRPAPAPLGRVLPVASVRQVPGADGAQERAEAAPGRVRPRDQVALQDVGEEVLGPVLRLLGRVTRGAGRRRRWGTSTPGTASTGPPGPPPSSRPAAVATRLHCVVGKRPGARPSGWSCGMIAPGAERVRQDLRGNSNRLSHRNAAVTRAPESPKEALVARGRTDRPAVRTSSLP